MSTPWDLALERLLKIINTSNDPWTALEITRPVKYQLTNLQDAETY